MFVKETKVKRGGRAYTYVQLVEGYRDEQAGCAIVLWQTSGVRRS